MTLWPSGLRRWLKAPFRKGVGSNPTGVNLFHLDSSSLLVGWICIARLIHPHASSLLVLWTSQDKSRCVMTRQDKSGQQDKTTSVKWSPRRLRPSWFDLLSRGKGASALKQKAPWHIRYTRHITLARSYQPGVALGIEPRTSRPASPRWLQQAPGSVRAPCLPLN
jgi:hypothetical protein